MVTIVQTILIISYTDLLIWLIYDFWANSAILVLRRANV